MQEMSGLQELGASESSGGSKTSHCCPSSQMGTAILSPVHSIAILKMPNGRMQRVVTGVS
jgi:hypothetical protein